MLVSEEAGQSGVGNACLWSPSLRLFSRYETYGVTIAIKKCVIYYFLFHI